MLSEILPYLNVPSESTKTDNSNNENLITVPNIKDKTIAEAQKTLEDAGFKVKVTCSGDVNTELVSEQNPKPGIALSKSSVIMLYSKDAVVSLAIGGIILVIAGMALNAWYLLPKYSELYGLPMDTLIAMGTKVNASIKDVFSFVALAVAPFNVIKAVIDGVITVVLYKYLSHQLKD